MKRTFRSPVDAFQRKTARNEGRMDGRRRFESALERFTTGVQTFLLAILCTLLPSRAPALEARIGTTFLDLPRPSGYVNAKSLPHGFLTFMSRFMPGDVRIIGGCVKAKDAARLARGDYTQMEGCVVYATAREIEDLSVDERFFREFRQGFAQSAEESVRKGTIGPLPWFRSEWKEAGVACDVRVVKLRPFGILFDADRCIGQGCVIDMEARSDAGALKSSRWLFSTTAILVRGKIVIAFAFETSRREADVEQARRFALALAANVLAMNGSGPLTPTPECDVRISNEFDLFERNPLERPLFFTHDWKEHVFKGSPAANAPALSIKAPPDWKRSTMRTSKGFDMTKLASQPSFGLVRSCVAGVVETGVAEEIARMLERKPDIFESKEIVDKLEYLKLANGELLRCGLTQVDGKRACWTESRHDLSSPGKSSDFKVLMIFLPWAEKNAICVLGFCVESENGRSAMERGWKEAAPIFREMLNSAAVR